MIIERNKYLNQLIIRKHNGLIKVITGIRRCGKSFLLNNIFYNHLINEGVDFDHIIKFAFDSFEDLNLINEKLVDFNERNYKVNPEKFITYISSQIKDDKMYYLLLDEVQNMANFETVLNGLLRKSNLDIYVTGSNAKFLSSDIITEFRGRGDQVHLSPLSFKEFFDATHLDFENAWNEYAMYGGMPFLLNCKSDEQKVNYLTNLFNETYIKDIVNRNKLRNTELLEDLLNFLASSIGSLTNPTKLSNTYKSLKNQSIASNTISQYLDYCVDSFLISRAYRYDVKGKKYLNTTLKYYFSDVGLRNARLGFRQQEENHILENVIYNELKSRDFNVDVGVVNINVKNQNDNYIKKQLEVDFVCNLGYERYYIQSALNVGSREKREQEEKSLVNIKDSFRKIVIVRDNIKKWKDENGVLFLGLKEFLLNPDSINS